MYINETIERNENPASSMGGALSTVYLMDCIEGMKQYPDKYFDLACVDPPYGIGAGSKSFIRKGKQTGKSMAVSGAKYTAKDWDSCVPDKIYFDELTRVSKNQILWGGNYFSSSLPNSSCWLIWDKVTGENLYADCELAWTSFDKAVRKFTWMWKGMFQQNMANKEDRIHPTQKPVALYDWIFHNYAKEGDKILDTHLGSQSSRIAANKAGLDFVGFEVDREYYDQGNKRFKDFVSQMRLF